MNDRRIRVFDLSVMVTKNQASVKSRFGFCAKADGGRRNDVIKPRAKGTFNWVL